MVKTTELDASAFLDDERVIAESTGLCRESLYKAMTPKAKPRDDTVLEVLHSLGVKLTVSAA